MNFFNLNPIKDYSISKSPKHQAINHEMTTISSNSILLAGIKFWSLTQDNHFLIEDESTSVTPHHPRGYV